MLVTARRFSSFTLCSLLLAGPLAGCTVDSKQNPISTQSKPQSDKPQSESAPAESIHKNRVLSQGYAQLYEAASGLQHVKKLLYVQFESEKVGAMIEDISKYGEKLAGQLERLVANYPGLRIDDTGLPEMEIKKRKAAQWDRTFSLVPIVGQTGKEFERTLLLTQSGALNQLRFLAEVMHDSEKDDNRKAFLREVKQGFDSLYDKVVKLLNDEYFC
jgi:hypothetical protein